MRALPPAVGDVALALFAIAVMTGAVIVVTESPAASPTSLVSSQGQPTTTPVATTAAPTTTPSASPSSTPLQTLVVAGPDFERLHDALAAATGASVIVAESGGASQVIATDALKAVRFVPSVVMLEVPAGSRTSLRTSDAITAVRATWPDVRLVVIGPFSSEDRKSAAAVQAAATAAGATFLDPVELGWRLDATPAALTDADLEVVAGKLANALS